ncbi:hypothetical protein MNR01_02420 [Lysobacter sp. S4-A87]|uniref:hypothetical protein n=1 Tax=Lysobacter sp. S4-A87 TaxID=2925843 RepID=UPI001F530924|nr:hypothetical protein [Lysobacter sp. S4-A87]UNK49913.1 hypothetical protein MNR01_02420 [Lysobacter sp. S4-A87]
MAGEVTVERGSISDDPEIKPKKRGATMQNEVLLEQGTEFKKEIGGHKHVLRIGARIGAVMFADTEYFYDLESKYSAAELTWMENRFLAHRKRLVLEQAEMGP